jgi:hypothetical protein
MVRLGLDFGGFKIVIGSRLLPSSERRPPSPLPEGEGADRVVGGICIDLKNRVELRM